MWYGLKEMWEELMKRKGVKVGQKKKKSLNSGTEKKNEASDA